MDKHFLNALVSQDHEFIKELLNPTNKTLQPPLIDYKVLSDQLHEFKWPLRKVVSIGKADLTRLFLRAGNGSMEVEEGLHEAVYNVDVDHVRWLLQEFNADPNSFDQDFCTPISYLYSDIYEYPYADHDQSIDAHDAVEIMKMLIDKGADIVTHGDVYDYLQVENILKKGTSEAVSIILDMGEIDPRKRYHHAWAWGRTVVHYLAQNQNPNTLTLLQNRDFHVNSRDDSGHSPLWIAATYGVAHAVEFLLKKGADVNIASGGSTSLHTAILRYKSRKADYMECILLLLEYGAEVQPQYLLDDDLPSTMVFDVLCQLQVDQRPSEAIIQHLALQAAIGTTITERVQNTINSDPDLKKELDNSRQLLQRKIYGSWTLFSVLTCGEEKVVSLMRNEQLSERLQSYLQSNSSIYYNRLLQKRLTKAGQIIELRGKAAFVIGKLMEMDYNCQPVVIDLILRYLDLEDLDTLVSFIS